MRFEEVYGRPYDYNGSPCQLLVTLSRDAQGRWWHTVGGKIIREATWIETLLPLVPAVWAQFTP